jgi:hypothetical protein
MFRDSAGGPPELTARPTHNWCRCCRGATLTAAMCLVAAVAGLHEGKKSRHVLTACACLTGWASDGRARLRHASSDHFYTLQHSSDCNAHALMHESKCSFEVQLRRMLTLLIGAIFVTGIWRLPAQGTC